MRLKFYVHRGQSTFGLRLFLVSRLNFRAEVGYSLIPGEKGGVGSDGEPGENGSIGRPGSEGKPGKPGAKGVPGPQGQSGRCGPPGSRGEVGAVGSPGPFGNPGNTGPAGTGIETQEYYQKYKAILRKQMEDGLDKVINDQILSKLIIWSKFDRQT